MTTTITDQEKHWEMLDGVLDGLYSAIKELSKNIDRYTGNDLKNGYALMDKYIETHRLLLAEQSRIEMWLIENEAPGWVST